MINKSRRIKLVLGVSAIALLAILFLVVQSISRATPMLISAPPPDTGGRSVSLPMGVPAIKPVLGQTDTNTPAITSNDVIVYVTTRDALPKLGFDSNAKVTQVEFVTEQQVRARLNGESTGLPDNTLLCYVELTGSFSVSGPPGSTSTAANSAYLVFDAHTGNLLLYGVR